MARGEHLPAPSEQRLLAAKAHDECGQSKPLTKWSRSKRPLLLDFHAASMAPALLRPVRPLTIFCPTIGARGKSLYRIVSYRTVPYHTLPWPLTQTPLDYLGCSGVPDDVSLDCFRIAAQDRNPPLCKSLPLAPETDQRGETHAHDVSRGNQIFTPAPSSFLPCMEHS